MTEIAPKRRITALMMADVAGYSRLVGLDESGTVKRVRQLRQELLEPAIAARAGRLVKAMGDGPAYTTQCASHWTVGLSTYGYIEGQNIAFEFRFADGNHDRLREFAAELARLRVDIIVAHFTPAATAAREATSTIPIIMAWAGDPIGTGLISSLARPGGNITGLSGGRRTLRQISRPHPRCAARRSANCRPGARARSILDSFH